MRGFQLRVGVLAVTVTLAGVQTAVAAPPAPTVDRAATHMVAKVTGPGPLNETAARWNIWGTDIGHTFRHEGQTYMVFGDTFGVSREGDAEHLEDWRSNSLGRLSPLTDPRIGPLIEDMVTDKPLRSKEILSSRKDLEPQPDGSQELTVIPMAGISIGGRMYLQYQSIAHFDEGGTWTADHSGIAYSDDDGETWTKSPKATWPGDSNFAEVTWTKLDGWVYALGIPGGRFGGMKAARVRPDVILNPSRYQYWNGARWLPAGSSASEAVVSSKTSKGLVLPPRVGEHSVQWNSYYGKWILLYAHIDADGQDTGVVMRTADCLTGPWSDLSVVIRPLDYPTAYAPNIPPTWNDGPDIWFASSIWGVDGSITAGFTGQYLPWPLPVGVPYNVFWMHTAIHAPPDPTARPCGTGT